MAKSDLAAAAVELQTRAAERYLAEALADTLEPYSTPEFPTARLCSVTDCERLGAGQSRLVPVQAEYYALEGLLQLLGTTTLKACLNPELAVAGILLTMADGLTCPHRRGRVRASHSLRHARLHEDHSSLDQARRGS